MNEPRTPDDGRRAQKYKLRALALLHPALVFIGVGVVVALGAAWERGYFDQRSIPEERAVQGSDLVHQLLAAGISRVQRKDSSFRVDAVDVGKLHSGVCAWNQEANPAQDFASRFCQSSDRSGYDYILDLTQSNIVYRGDSLSEDVSKADFLAWMALDTKRAIQMVEKARQERRQQESQQKEWSESASHSDQHPSSPSN